MECFAGWRRIPPNKRTGDGVWQQVEESQAEMILLLADYGSIIALRCGS